MERSRIGFVVGLAAEAALLKGRGFAVGIGGGKPTGAAEAARRLAAAGATALISFGVAGGLDPRLRPGALMVPRAVSADDAVYACDAVLTTFLGGANASLAHAGTRIVATVSQKAALFAQTGAVMVDLESGAIAGVASSLGLPFAVLRAVVDSAVCDLPPAALLPMKPGGQINLASVLASVARQPGQFLGLLRLTRDAARARRALSEALAALPHP